MTEEIGLLFTRLASSRDGLSSSDAVDRLIKYGPNLIEEKKGPFPFKFFKYFSGPIPWIIEIGAVISAVLGHWFDLSIIIAFLLINGIVGFWKEFQANHAIDTLKKKMAHKSVVKRDKIWIEIDSTGLVPGDIIRCRMGNIVPADVSLVEGGPLTIDQPTETGESFLIEKKMGDLIYSNSIMKNGEMEGVVVSTGKNTFFGKRIKFIEKPKASAQVEKAILQISEFLTYGSVSLACLILIVELLRGNSFSEAIQFSVVLIIASIPVLMPAVLSTTMALGALGLSRMKAIVTRLESIQAMAGMDILCCDKTGTLTENKLRLEELIVFQNQIKDELLISAALASKVENQDPIDLAIFSALKDLTKLNQYKQKQFVPFDSVIKRTEASIVGLEGNSFYVMKGAPHVILSFCKEDALVEESITNCALSGYRTIGVAKSTDEKKTWQFLGLITFSDPLRRDSKQTMIEASEHGIVIKMITGDSIAVAKEIARELKIGDRIKLPQDLKKSEDLVDQCDGFAEVYPEDKYHIIQEFQKKNFIVGMTGDGVNDALALKQAEVGIAVSGATDVAKLAASLIFTSPGLSTIIYAIEEARKIFDRMNSYAIYRISETISIVGFVVLSTLICHFYPITAAMVILLALLNDIPVMMIVYDHTPLEFRPLRWDMKKVIMMATVLGSIGVLSTFILLVVAKFYLYFTVPQLQSLIFLKLSMSGHQMFFVIRAKGAWFSKPYPSLALFGAIFITEIIAVLIVGFGFFITAIPWSYIGYLWLYTLIWMFIADQIKKHLT